LNQVWLTRPGIASIFPPRAGTHQLWDHVRRDYGELDDALERHDEPLDRHLPLRVLELPVVLMALDPDLQRAAGRVRGRDVLDRRQLDEDDRHDPEQDQDGDDRERRPPAWSRHGSAAPPGLRPRFPRRKRMMKTSSAVSTRTKITPVTIRITQ
jgi:hypothetical protein